MKKIKNSFGFAHHALLGIAVIAVIAFAGVKVLTAIHADTQTHVVYVGWGEAQKNSSKKITTLTDYVPETGNSTVVGLGPTQTADFSYSTGHGWAPTSVCYSLRAPLGNVHVAIKAYGLSKNIVVPQDSSFYNLYCLSDLVDHPGKLPFTVTVTDTSSKVATPVLYASQAIITENCSADSCTPTMH